MAIRLFLTKSILMKLWKFILWCVHSDRKARLKLGSAVAVLGWLFSRLSRTTTWEHTVLWIRIRPLTPPAWANGTYRRPNLVADYNFSKPSLKTPFRSCRGCNLPSLTALTFLI